MPMLRLVHQTATTPLRALGCLDVPHGDSVVTPFEGEGQVLVKSWERRGAPSAGGGSTRPVTIRRRSKPVSPNPLQIGVPLGEPISFRSKSQAPLVYCCTLWFRLFETPRIQHEGKHFAIDTFSPPQNGESR